MLQIKRPPRLTVLLATLLVSLVGCSCPEEAARDARGWPGELVLGLVPALEAEALVDNLQPLTAHLSRELGLPVRSFVPADYTGLVEALGAGHADIGMLPPFAAMLGMRRYDLEPVLISVRDGARGYHAQWLTHDADICTSPPSRDADNMLHCEGTLDAVRGARVAFTDPNSTSGYLFPALQLLDAGIDPRDDIRPLFVGAHDAAVLAVRAGDVRFAATYEDARRMVRRQYPDIGGQVIRFQRSALIPNDGVVLRPELPASLRTAIREAFMSLEAAEQHLPQDQRTLRILYDIDGFAPLPDNAYAPVADSYDRLQRDG